MSPGRSAIRAGLSRVLRLFLAVLLISGLFAIACGALLGAGISRSLSVGWYCAGALLFVIAFAASTRGPTRSSETGSWSPVSLRGRSLRWANRDEQDESINLAAVFVVLGLGLIVLGTLIDPIHPLFLIIH